MDKKVYQLFIGKVADEIGMDKCSRLLKESSDSFKEPLKKCACNLNEAHMCETCFKNKSEKVKHSVGFPFQKDHLSIKDVPDTFRSKSDGLIEIFKPIKGTWFTSINILRDHNVFSLNKFEQELGMPQGYLSRAINNKRALPKEWEATLKKYLLNLAKNINEKMI